MDFFWFFYADVVFCCTCVYSCTCDDDDVSRLPPAKRLVRFLQLYYVKIFVPLFSRSILSSIVSLRKQSPAKKAVTFLSKFFPFQVPYFDVYLEACRLWHTQHSCSTSVSMWFNLFPVNRHAHYECLINRRFLTKWWSLVTPGSTRGERKKKSCDHQSISSDTLYPIIIRF